MHVVFDLDGVLVDSKDAVQEAYGSAGVQMPDEAWRTPWRSWLIDYCGGDIKLAERLHDAKNLAYTNYIKTHSLLALPGMHLLHALRSCDLAEVSILTSASRPAVDAILAQTWTHLSGQPRVLGTGMTQTGKTDALLGLAPRGVYIDDNPFEVDGWRVIRYDQDETFESLKDKLWMP